MFQPLCT